MKSKLFIFIILLVFIYSAQSRFRPNLIKKSTSPPQIIHKFTQQQYTFDQILDHSNYQSQQFWKQRYWVVNNYFVPKVGPVYIFLCGEWICGGVDQHRQWILTLAQKTMGLIIFLQHRFYGDSLPYGKDSFKIQNMKILTSEQALSDTAYFIRQMNLNKMYGISQNPWITVGGSYPGALSAWFRSKYPHLTIGAISSSPVVQAIENFQDFDLQMYLSAIKSGDYCQKAINSSNTKVQSILDSSQGQTFKNQFVGGNNLKNDEFMFFWIDAIVMKIQYGERTTFCEALKDKSTDDQFNYLVEEVKNHQVYEYGSFYLKNDTYPSNFDSDQSNRITARAWYYQSCTQFGFWQTPHYSYPLRSQKLNLNFYKRFCSDSYGQGTWPKTDRKNTQTGGWNLQASNIFMVNGDQDPWKWATILKDKGDIISRQADCNDCAHVPQLYTPRIDDPPQLKKIRDEQFLTIQEWISQYWRTKAQKRISNIIKQTTIILQ